MKQVMSARARNVFVFAIGSILQFAESSLHAGWTSSKDAVGVLGQSDFSSDSANQGGANPSETSLKQPYDLAIDPTTGKLFVCDGGNHRILRFSSAAAAATGSAAEAVFGQDDFTTSNAGSAANRFNTPRGITVDTAGRLWVADANNARVLMFANASSRTNGPAADGLLGAITFGGAVFGNGAGEFSSPEDVSAGVSGVIWVVDGLNHRVMRFDNGATLAEANAQDNSNNLGIANGVLGQAGFGSSEINRGSGSNAPVVNGFDRPSRCEADGLGNLWVVDAFNNRIVLFNDAANKANGADADGLLGSKDFLTETSVGAGQDRFWGVRGIALDPAGDLWVAEELNRRAVRFADAAAAAISNAANPASNTALPDVVLGQPDFDTNALPGPPSAGLMSTCVAVCASVYGQLWIADTSDHRVLHFIPDADSYRVDGLIGLRRSGLRGNNLYNSSGGGQSVASKSKKLKKLKFYLRQENDGDYGDDLRLSGTKKNKFFRIDYFRTTGGRQKVTAQVIAGGYLDRKLSSHALTDFEIEVKPLEAAAGRKKTRKLSVTSRSIFGGLTDIVKATAKTVK